MALENEAVFLRKAVRAGVLDVDKGTAALYVYSQLQQMGAKFSFGQFLVERGLLSNIALSALEGGTGKELRTVDTVGDFELVEMIGEGQNGAVFKAMQKSLRRHVALKILNADIAADPEALQRFMREARATAKLNHPNIVQGIDVGSDQGLHYFAMELVDGGSAKKLLESGEGALEETAALRLTLEVAEGLKAAHAAGILHRDLKPDNILLTQDGHAKIADLGISQNLTAKPGQDFWASPPYVAPEIIRGLAENDPRSDIYSLGATLFEFLTGQPPYVGETPEETMQMHLTAPVPDIQTFRPDVSIQTASLLKRMLAKELAERVPSAQTVIDGVRRILAMKHQAAIAAEAQAPAPAPQPAAPPPRRMIPRRGSGAQGRPGARPRPRGRR